jgi:tRNA(fMet)-specific endonuclease VapC
MIVADTDVLIDYLRGKGAAERIRVELSTSQLTTTAISSFELRSGCKNQRQERCVEDLLSALSILPFGSREAQLAARLRQTLEGSGHGIGMADYLIAATCMVHQGQLLTRNRAHFERLVPSGLALSDSPK